MRGASPVPSGRGPGAARHGQPLEHHHPDPGGGEPPAPAMAPAVDPAVRKGTARHGNALSGGLGPPYFSGSHLGRGRGVIFLVAGMAGTRMAVSTSGVGPC